GKLAERTTRAGGPVPGTRTGALLLDLIAAFRTRKPLTGRHPCSTDGIAGCSVADVTGLGHAAKGLSPLLRHPDQELLHRFFIATIVLDHPFARCATVAH